MLTKYFLSVLTCFVFIGSCFAAGHTLNFYTSSTCQGSSYGQASVNVTGGAGPFSYSWSNGATTASIDNLVAGTYTVTVTDDSDGSTETGSCTVDEIIPVVPNFPSPLTLCQGDNLTLPYTSPNGIDCVHAPATVDNQNSGTYYFTPNPGQCATTTTVTVNVVPKVLPTFDPVGPICYNDWVPALPHPSKEGITGVWNPSTISNTYNSTHTFTPNAGFCANSTTLPITLTQRITPTFDPRPPYCAGDPNIPFFSSTSNEGIPGSWAPGPISNTASGTYIFTPQPGYCANTTSVQIVITPRFTPSFSTLPNICQGAVTPVLQNPSNDGVSGTWTPSTISSASAGTQTFTFTPTPGICANETLITITIDSPVTPTFSVIPAICSGTPAPTLPTTSDNNYTGIWNPSAVSNTATYTYTFTPNVGQCATTTSLTVTVDPTTVPDFAPIPPICSGGPAPTLNTTSPNGVSGIWTPSNVSTSATGNYTFTPDGAVCASSVEIIVSVGASNTPVFDPIGPFCEGTATTTLPSVSKNGIMGIWDPVAIDNAQTRNYTFTPTDGSCSVTTEIQVNITPAQNPVLNPIGPLCLIDQFVALGADLPGTWSGQGVTGSFFNPIHSGPGVIPLTFTPSGCANIGTMAVIVHSDPVLTGNQTYTTCANVPVQLEVFGATSYSWVPFTGLSSPAVSNPVATVPSNITYTVTGTDVNGCSSTTQVNVVVSAGLTITATPNTSSICVGQCVDMLLSGADNYTVAPASSISIISGGFQLCPQATTVYQINGSNANGCTGSTTVTVNVSPPGAAASFNPIAALCKGATPVPSLPAQSLQGATGTWDPATIDNMNTTTYTFTPSAGSCLTSTTMQVVVNEVPIAIASSNSPVCVGDTLFLYATTSPGSTYSWTSATLFSSNLQSPQILNATTNMSGKFYLTVNRNGCSSLPSETDVVVTNSIVPTFNALPTSICKGLTSIPTLPAVSDQGIAGSWSPSVINNKINQNYYFSPTAGSCSTFKVVTINVAPIDAFVSTVPVTACRACDGSATVSSNNGTAPYTVQWLNVNGNNVATGETATGMCTGKYYAQLVDSKGCQGQAFGVVGNGSNLDISYTVSNETCNASNGSITAVASGGSGEYVYNWTPSGINSPYIANLKAGTYTLVVEDSSGCKDVETIVLVNEGAPNITLQSTETGCADANGSIKVLASGSVPPFTYSINGGAFGTSNEFSGLNRGNYILRVKSNGGCISEKQQELQGSSSLVIQLSKTQTSCQLPNGTATITLPNGDTGVSYAWSNGATTATATDLAVGFHYCELTDSLGCKKKISFNIEQGPQLHASVYDTYDQCGKVNVPAYVSGGQQPYTYLWSRAGETTNYLMNVSAGNYSVTVTDSEGCTVTRSFKVTPTPYSQILPRVFNDANGNCVFDANEKVLVGTTTAVSSTKYYSGYYSITVPNAVETYSVGSSFVDNIYYKQNCSANTIQTTGDCKQIPVDIPITRIALEDLEISGYCGTPRPGFVQSNSIYIKNRGTVNKALITVKADIDPLLTLIGANPAPSRISGSHIEWDIANFNSDMQSSIFLSLQVPTIQNGGTLGKVLPFSCSIEPKATDGIPGNNDYSCSREIVGSYDPNAKYVHSEDARSAGEIDSSGALMEYHIDFQNTGTDTAFTIVVRDTLSPYLDLSTFRFIGASHNYKWSIEPDRVLEVHFQDILLPDSNRNEPMSHGHFDFTIRTHKHLPLYASIKNTADIYFDFNEPVITNTVKSEIVAFLSVPEHQKFNSLVYPNPLHNEQLNVRLKGIQATGVNFQLTDANGRLVFIEYKGDTDQFSVELSDLESGIYFFTLSNNAGEKETGKLIVTK